MRAKTIEIISKIRNESHHYSNKEWAKRFGCHPNNITNIRRRYKKYFDDLTLPLNLNDSKETNKQKNKQTKLTIPLVDVNDIRFLMKLWNRLETKRLVSKEVRNEFISIILKINNIEVIK